MQQDYEVKVIRQGYATWLGPTKQKADGTVTLIKGRKLILVDTAGPHSRDALLQALKNESVKPGDIDYVVCTHGHLDHTGNNNLFANATFILSYDICKGDEYTFHDFTSERPYKIDDSVEVIPTPGHTNQDVSVIVRTRQATVAIVGDLFERTEDVEDESLWRSFSEFPEDQEESRKIIIAQADYIVPGHGEMFLLGRQGAKVSAEPVGRAVSTNEDSIRGALLSRVMWQVLAPLLVAVLGGLTVWFVVWLMTRG